MKYARLYLFLALGIMLCSLPARAQEDDIGTATSALQDVLSNLKQSVEKLSLDNDQLTARDNAMKSQVSQLQMQLGALQAQGDLLNRSAGQLQGNNPRRAQEIARLENENYDLDNRIQKDEAGIKSFQESLEPGYQEYQRLLVQLKSMNDALVLPPAPPPLPVADDHLQKEKLKLMKMIYDSQQRQESLHQAILDYQKNAPLQPADNALAEQELLKEQIKDMQAQIAAYPSKKFEAGEQSSGIQSNRAFWDDSQLRQLEEELKALERNYIQLKALMDQMSKKTQGARITVSQQVEAEKLQNKIEDLKRQGIGLRVDLDELRSQMVDLDKRKSHLETMINQLQ